MKLLFRGIILGLILLGAVKTFHDYDLVNEVSHYYDQAKNGQLIENISNVNNFKNLDLSNFKPSDFF